MKWNAHDDTAAAPLRTRLPLMALAGVAALAGGWAGLLRIGWVLPDLSAQLAAQHGPLMLSGFLGALIALERAVALQRRWAYAAPALCSIGAIGLVIGAPDVFARAVIFAGSLVLAAAFALIVRIQASDAHWTMAAGALAWLMGNALWLADWPLFRVTPWWLCFLVLTVAGERLELARVFRHTRTVRVLFASAVTLIAAGLLMALFTPAAGIRTTGIGLFGLGAWLVRFDIARKTLLRSGLTRYIAACLLPGYAWLGSAGVLWVLHAEQMLAGPYYDAMLHAVLVGFVISMLFGHAPIVVSALLARQVRYTAWLYVPLALLHASLLARMIGDIAPHAALREWGGLFNAIAALLFLALLAPRLRHRL